MMKIRDFIRKEIFGRKLEAHRVLVVYDPARRYREIALGMRAEGTTVVDATESGLLAREEAGAAFRALARSAGRLLVYVPAERPADDTQRQRDPFSVYARFGAEFPHGDGEEYKNLCLRAQPDHPGDVLKLFGNGAEPTLDMVDAIGGGDGWPILRTVLSAGSSKEILRALLFATEDQKDGLKRSEGWTAEAKSLFESVLGFRPKTRAKAWKAIADELWEFLLFSEFAFDLPGDLPPALAPVPRAKDSAKPVVFDLCDEIRNDIRNVSVYVGRAREVQAKFGLESAFRNEEALGERDTFPFEERKYFAQAVAAARKGDFDALRRLVRSHADTVWSHDGENMLQWRLVEAAAESMRACADAERELSGHAATMDSLLDFYERSFHEVDRRQREYEQADAALAEKPERADGLRRAARDAYRAVAGKAHAVFLEHLGNEGWPPHRRLSNADAFDRLVAPLLKEAGRKVAVILVDALRYELGAELKKQLSRDASSQVSLCAAFAVLPTITPVGMAGHLPDAGSKLRLKKKNAGAVVEFDGKELPQVPQRMEVLRAAYGDRFEERPLRDFLDATAKKAAPKATVDLLVLRSNEIDSGLEADSSTALRTLQDALKPIGAAIHRLRDFGFRDAFVFTDHGFFLNTAAEAGDVCTKPPGDWLCLHDRILLGNGAGDAANVVLPADKAGVRGDFAEVAFPKALVPYKAGVRYFHGGASLQETVVPVLTVSAAAVEEPLFAEMPAVSLSYRKGLKKITTRIPVIDVLMDNANLFGGGETYELRLEAVVKGGETVVGEASAARCVNPATGLVSIQPGQSLSVPLRMVDPDFNGKFTVRALDPITNKCHCSLDLETDYPTF